MTEIEKQIEQLKTRMFYLRIAIIFIIGTFFTTYFSMLRDYSTIRSYYQESLAVSRQLTETVQTSIETGEKVLLALQEFQTEKN